MEQIKLPKPLTWEEIQKIEPDQRLYYVYDMQTVTPSIGSAFTGDIGIEESFADECSTAFYLRREDADYMKQLHIQGELYFNSEAKSWELKEEEIVEDIYSDVKHTKVTHKGVLYPLEHNDLEPVFKGVDTVWHDSLVDSILLEAHSIVNGSRKADYKGTEGFEKISAVWNTLYPNKPLTAYDVAMLMVILKTVRESVTPKRDNLVDACGYLHFVNELSKQK